MEHFSGVKSCKTYFGDTDDVCYRRLRVNDNFPDTVDNRSDEEKRFYLKSDWTSQSEKYQTLHSEDEI